MDLREVLAPKSYESQLHEIPSPVEYDTVFVITHTYNKSFETVHAIGTLSTQFPSLGTTGFGGGGCNVTEDILC